MTGHVRRHGSGWQFTADMGRWPAQRCPSCRKRRWVDEKGPAVRCGPSVVLAAHDDPAAP